VQASRLWLGPGVVIEPDGDQLTFRRDDAIVARVVTPERRDAAVVGSELWVIDQAGWSRYALEHSRVGERIERPLHHTALAGPGFLVSSGSRATWNGRDCAILSGDGSVEPVPGAELAVAISRTATFSVGANALRLHQQGVDVWRVPLPARVTMAAPLFGGRSIALVVSERATRIVVLDARAGTIHHRIRIDDLTQIAFASQRGWALMRLGDRRVMLVDLRFGQKLREYVDADAIEAIAIDDSGHQVALVRAGEPMARVLSTASDAEWSVGEVASMGDAVDGDAAPAPIVSEPVADADTASEAVDDTVTASAPEHDSDVLDTNVTLGLLHPIVPAPRATPDEAAEVMRRHVALVAALVERAIAEAWDVGRLAPAAAGGFLYAAELDGILGLTAGAATERLRAAEQRIQQAQAALLGIVRSIEPRRAPLTELALEFGLTPLAADVLMVIAAPTLWGELARAYAILANDVGRPLCDELLVCQILAPRAARRAIARTLDRDSPLRHYGLITVGSGGRRPFDALKPDPLVIRRLRALPLDADIEPNLRIVPATRKLEEMILPPGVAATALAALSASPGVQPVRIAARGRLGSGRRTLLAALAERAGRRLAVIDGSYYAHEPALRATQLELALGRAHLRGWLPCVENIDDLGENDRVARQRILDVFRTHPGPVALRLAWDAPVPLDAGYVDLELPVLTERQRATAWSQAITRHRLSVVEPAALASRFRLGPGVVERVCETVACAKRATSDLDDSRALDAAARQHLSRQIGEHAQHVRRLATWSDIVLPPDVMDSVLELTSRIRHRRRVFEEWGYDERISTSRGLTALFQGGPGTGKTLVASAIARDLGLDLYRVDLSRVISKWVGETERNLANLFDAAEDGQAIILFDEADSLFAKRTEVRTSVDRYANLEVNYLLQRLDTFEGIALLTTNFGGSIDRAFQRRLTLRLTFPFPDEEMREQLWRVHIPERVPRRGSFDLAMLARKYRLSGGYIRNACLRAAFLAAEDGGTLTQEHLERAVRLEFREIGKLGDGGVLE
jgi:hypothetical protein